MAAHDIASAAANLSHSVGVGLKKADLVVIDRIRPLAPGLETPRTMGRLVEKNGLAQAYLARAAEDESPALPVARGGRILDSRRTVDERHVDEGFGLEIMLLPNGPQRSKEELGRLIPRNRDAEAACGAAIARLQLVARNIVREILAQESLNMGIDIDIATTVMLGKRRQDSPDRQGRASAEEGRDTEEPGDVDRRLPKRRVDRGFDDKRRRVRAGPGSPETVLDGSEVFRRQEFAFTWQARNSVGSFGVHHDRCQIVPEQSASLGILEALFARRG